MWSFPMESDALWYKIIIVVWGRYFVETSTPALPISQPLSAYQVEGFHHSIVLDHSSPSMWWNLDFQWNLTNQEGEGLSMLLHSLLSIYLSPLVAYGSLVG